MVPTVAGEEYLAILLLLVIALLFGVLTLFFGRFFRLFRGFSGRRAPRSAGRFRHPFFPLEFAATSDQNAA